jgi:hypothetical protein
LDASLLLERACAIPFVRSLSQATEEKPRLAYRLIDLAWQDALASSAGGSKRAVQQSIQEAVRLEGFALESTLRILHGCGDYLSQVVNGLVLTPPLPLKACGLKSQRFLKRLDAQDDCKSLAAALRRLAASDSFRLLDDFVNTSKHRYLIPSSYPWSLEPGGGTPPGVYFEVEFESNDTTAVISRETVWQYAAWMEDEAKEILDQVLAVARRRVTESRTLSTDRLFSVGVFYEEVTDSVVCRRLQSGQFQLPSWQVPTHEMPLETMHTALFHRFGLLRGKAFLVERERFEEWPNAYYFLYFVSVPPGALQLPSDHVMTPLGPLLESSSLVPHHLRLLKDADAWSEGE